VSEVLKRHLGLQVSESFIRWYSIYDLQSDSNHVTLSNPPISRLLEVGTLHQIGCGAVGSSLDLLFSFLNIKGNIHLIDYDSVSVPNTASSMVFTAKDGLEEIDKVDSCYSFLEKVDGLIPYPHKCDYGTFIKKHDLLNDYPDIVLCLANEKNIWSTIQHNYPPLVLHATTSPNWGVNLVRHIPFQDWCIVCRFGIDEYETIPVCSQAKVDSGGEKEEILGILPFLSTAGAILILSEILRSRIDGYCLTKDNFVQFSFKDTNVGFIKLKLSRNENCTVCNNQTKEEYSFLRRQISYNQIHKGE